MKGREPMVAEQCVHAKFQDCCSLCMCYYHLSLVFQNVEGKCFKFLFLSFSSLKALFLGFLDLLISYLFVADFFFSHPQSWVP